MLVYGPQSDLPIYDDCRKFDTNISRAWWSPNREMWGLSLQLKRMVRNYRMAPLFEKKTSLSKWTSKCGLCLVGRRQISNEATFHMTIHPNLKVKLPTQTFGTKRIRYSFTSKSIYILFFYFVLGLIVCFAPILLLITQMRVCAFYLTWYELGDMPKMCAGSCNVDFIHTNLFYASPMPSPLSSNIGKCIYTFAGEYVTFSIFLLFKWHLWLRLQNFLFE